MVASRFEENLDNTVNHFKLLRVAREERINALVDISWVFLPFQEQESHRKLLGDVERGNKVPSLAR